MTEEIRKRTAYLVSPMEEMEAMSCGSDPEFKAWFEALQLAATESFEREHGMDFKQFWLSHR